MQQYKFNDYRNKHKVFREKRNKKFERKFFHSHQYPDGHKGIDDRHFTSFEQPETH